MQMRIIYIYSQNIWIIDIISQISIYSGDLNTDHLNTKFFEVKISNARYKAMFYVLDQPFKYQTST